VTISVMSDRSRCWMSSSHRLAKRKLSEAYSQFLFQLSGAYCGDRTRIASEDELRARGQKRRRRLT
jgi:hypothetical protein